MMWQNPGVVRASPRAADSCQPGATLPGVDPRLATSMSSSGHLRRDNAGSLPGIASNGSVWQCNSHSVRTPTPGFAETSLGLGAMAEALLICEHGDSLLGL